MKKVLKLLLMVAPLLTDARLCATITARSQLAPVNNNNSVVLSYTDPNQGVSKNVAYITTTEPFLVTRSKSLFIKQSTLTPIEFDLSTGVPIHITLPYLHTTYIDRVIYNDTSQQNATPDSLYTNCALEFIKSFASNAKQDQAKIFIKEMGYNKINEDGTKEFIPQISNTIIYKENSDSNMSVYFKKIPNNINNENVNNNPDLNPNSNENSYNKLIGSYISNSTYSIERTEGSNIIKNAATMQDAAIKNRNTIFLNTIERLQGIKNPKLSSEDAKIIKDAVTNLIKTGNGAELNNDFLLQFDSTALQALKNMVKEADNAYSKTKKVSVDDISKFKNAVLNSLKILEPLQNYKDLKEQLANRIELDQKNTGSAKTAVLDWYVNLKPDQKLLIEYDYYASFNNGNNIFNTDPNLLNNTERAALKNSINVLLKKSSNDAQKADLQAKLKAIDDASTTSQTVDLLQKKLQKFNDPSAQDAMIEWLGTLSKEEQNSISQDVEAILVANTFNDIYAQTHGTDKRNIKELFILKTDLEDFILDSDTTKTAILDKANTKLLDWKSTAMNLSSDAAQKIINNNVDAVTKTINFKIINATDENRYLKLLDPTSKNIDAQIFKQLSLTDQKFIIDQLNNRKTDPTAKDQAVADLKTYQQAFLSQKIDQSVTIEELDKLKTEADSLGLRIDKTFSEKFNTIQEAVNKALKSGVPFVAENKPILIFEPEITNSSGQTEEINTKTGDLTPTNNQSTNPDNIKAENEMFTENSDLEDRIKEERQKQQEEDQQSRDEAKRIADEAHIEFE